MWAGSPSVYDTVKVGTDVDDAIRITSRFVARKVATNGDARGDKDCSSSFQFVRNRMLSQFAPSNVLSGSSNFFFFSVETEV